MGLTRKDFVRYSRPVLKTRRWQVLRQVILERDGWKCRCCGERRWLEVDHVFSVRTRPERAFDPSNLQVLCRSCHTRKTGIELGNKPVSPERQQWRDLLHQPNEHKEKHHA